MKFIKSQLKIPSGLFSAIYTLPPWQKVAVWAASWIVPIVLFWFFFLSPRLGEINALSGTIPQLRAEVEKLEAKAQQLPQIEEELKAMEGILTNAVKLLPESKDIPSVLTEISSLGNESRLEFLSFKPEKEQAKDFYAAIPVKIELRGPFQNTLGFFDKVGRMARIVHIRDIHMGNAKESAEVWSQTGSGPGSGGNENAPAGPSAAGSGEAVQDGTQGVERGTNWIINTRCEATTYRFLSEQEQKAAQQAAKKK